MASPTKRSHTASAARAPLSTHNVEEAEIAIGEAAAARRLPALPDRAGKSLGANDLMHLVSIGVRP